MRALALVPIVLVLAACGGEPGAPRAEGEGVRLLEAGESPRRMLRYEIGEGVERTRVECEIRASSGAEEHASRFAIVLETSTRRVGGGELFDQRVRIAEIEEAGDDPAQAAALRQLVGLTYAARVGANGWYEERTLPELASAPPPLVAARDALADIVLGMTPLPDEEVGPGARWEASARGAGGVRMRTTYHLLGFSGERGSRLRARIRPSTRPDGLRSEGHAEVTIDLRRAHPDGEIAHEREGEVRTAGGSIQLEQHVRVRLSPR